jgi:quaternary ammonium compound-resistance protein SugE
VTNIGVVREFSTENSHFHWNHNPCVGGSSPSSATNYNRQLVIGFMSLRLRRAISRYSGILTRPPARANRAVRRPRSRPRGGPSPGRPGDLKEVAVAWIMLIFAGLFEIVWATAMKQSHGFSRLWPSIITIIGMIISFGLLSWAMRTLPLGTAYMIWTGIGAVGAFVVGMLFFGESVSIMRIAAALLIVSGLVLMKLATPS